MLYRPLLKRSSLLTTTNQLDYLFDLTYTSGIIVNGCLLNLDITRRNATCSDATRGRLTRRLNMVW